MVKLKSPPKAQTIRNRVKELRMVSASELKASPFNWRRHPEFQKGVLRDALSEIGFAGAIIARETPEGLEIIDGHLRADIGGKEKLPVLVLDVDEAEAKKLLVSLDPIAALAVPDDMALKELLGEVSASGKYLQNLLDSLEEESLFSLSQGEMEIKLDKQNQVIKVAIFFPELALFEQALLATGEISREKALIRICEAYLGQGG